MVPACDLLCLPLAGRSALPLSITYLPCRMAEGLADTLPGDHTKQSRGGTQASRSWWPSGWRSDPRARTPEGLPTCLRGDPGASVHSVASSSSTKHGISI